jgi:hypothetical protein
MATGRVPTTANSPLTAKGDLFTYSTAPARLAVGLDGETIVADSSTSTGLRYGANFAAGKNKIINGDFGINQRAFTSTTVNETFGFDRFRVGLSGGTVTYSAQTFTPGAAPVSGYEATNFARLVSASQSSASNYAALLTKIEDVRTFAGQTVTLSFWAKASTGTPNIGASLAQGFGSGGSSQVTTLPTVSVQAITSSWARYSFTIANPSISGKTIGTGSNVEVQMWTSVGTTVSGAGFPAVGLQNVTIDIWGVQLEAGSVATAFQTATGTIQGELAACQRYYYLHASGNNVNIGAGGYYNANLFAASVSFPVSMRIAPSLVYVTGTGYYQIYANNTTDALDVLSVVRPTQNSTGIDTGTGTAGTLGHAGLLATANAASSIAFNAEL